MNVCAHDPFAPAALFDREGVTRLDDLETLLRQSDIVSLHSPLTAETRNLINAERLARMKPDAIIVNTARGGLIDEDALLAALRADRLAGAGLDTFAKEPADPHHPFWSEPRLVVTPHIGGVTRAANLRVGTEAAQAIVDYLAGKKLPKSRIFNLNTLSGAFCAAS